MRSSIKVGIGLVLAVLAGCTLPIGGSDEECCAYETRSTGGSVTTIKGTVVLVYEGVTIEHGENDLLLDPDGIAVAADLPYGWVPPPDAGAEDAGDAGDASSDAGDAGIGTARGWGGRGRVAVIDYGDTSAKDGTLVNARLISCDHPYAKLVGDGISFQCESGVRSPARIEPLTGTYRLGGNGAVVDIEGKTASGSTVHLTWSTYETPRYDYQACVRASFSC